MGYARNTVSSPPWLDGRYYDMKAESNRFGRVSQSFNGWGELRKQKKPPHTEVLYVWTLKYATLGPNQEQTLVLRSINNCSNDQLRESIQLCGIRLEQHAITQSDAELILDRCYAELQRRLDWTDRVKERNRGQSQIHQDQAPVDPST